MKGKKRIYSLLAALMMSAIGFAQEVTVEKNYKKSFVYEDGDKVDIRNKYGEVIVNTWYKDSVRLNVTLKASGKNQDNVNKVIRRVDIDLRKISNRVTGDTEVEKKGGGLLGDLMSEVGDYSKSVFSANKFTVDYEVWLPPTADLSIDNRFGDVYLASLEGRVNLTLAHGDVRGDRIEKEITVRHSFGRSDFEYVKEGDFNLRGVELSIEDGEELSFESSSSEITIAAVKNLQFNSRNDKFRLEEVQNVIGEGSFTEARIDHAIGNVKLDFNYGDILLSRLDKEFNQVVLTGKSTDIDLILDQASYIQTRIEGPEGKMVLPNSMLTLQREVIDDKTIILEGKVGNTDTHISQLTIHSDGGKVIVAIQDTPIFTDRDR